SAPVPGRLASTFLACKYRPVPPHVFVIIRIHCCPPTSPYASAVARGQPTCKQRTLQSSAMIKPQVKDGILWPGKPMLYVFYLVFLTEQPAFRPFDRKDPSSIYIFIFN